LDRLACILVEGGFGVEALQVADAAEHEQPDDALGPWGEVGLAVRRAPWPRGPRDAVAVQHRGQGQAGEAQAAIRQEAAAGPATTDPRRPLWCHVLAPQQGP